MTQLELFAGIGGFGLAGHWAGIETVCQVEIDPFCQKVLAKNFPHAHRHDDIKTFNGTQWRGVDIISGGFPCQPYSTAGKRLGTEDERHLWPEMLRVIREAQPRYVVGENVGGLISWSDGLVFQQVCADLEAEGYEVQPFILPACAVNAPHRRDRVWFVANNGEVRPKKSIQRLRSAFGIFQKAPNDFSRLASKQWNVINRDRGELRSGDGVSNWMDRIGSLGNAIVPQVAYQIFKAIIETEKQMQL